MSQASHLLRARDGHEARVSFVELFFDLIYVFAVTQLSHRLLEDLTLLGSLQTLVLWFAVWLGWQYTCWMTNWFDPDTLPIRMLLFAIMLVGLVLAAAIPDAFAERGLIFAGAYALIQVGRSVFIMLQLERSHALSPNFQRIVGWSLISAAFWIAGGLAHDPQLRLGLWIIAVACEYIAPMLGFYLPGLGRSNTQDWTIEGGHLAERCQLFVIVALGESILITGSTLAHHPHWDVPLLLAFLVAFIGSLAMWWVYFDTSSKAGSEVISHASDPGRIGALFHYVHVILIGGVIVSAVANELVIAEPDGRITTPALAALIAGPAIYLFGNALYKKVVYGRVPLSHLIGLLALAILVPMSYFTDRLMVGGLTTVLLVIVAAWEGCVRRASATSLTK